MTIYNDNYIITIFMLLPVLALYIYKLTSIVWNPFNSPSFITAQFLQSVVISSFCYFLGFFFHPRFPHSSYKLKVGIKMLPVSLCQLFHVIYTHFSFMEQKPYKHFTVLTFSLILIFTVIIRTVSLHFFVFADFFVVMIFIIGLTMSNPYRFTYSIKNTIFNFISSFLYSFLVVLTEKRGSIVNYSITRFTYYNHVNLLILYSPLLLFSSFFDFSIDRKIVKIYSVHSGSDYFYIVFNTVITFLSLKIIFLKGSTTFNILMSFLLIMLFMIQESRVFGLLIVSFSVFYHFYHHYKRVRRVSEEKLKETPTASD